MLRWIEQIARVVARMLSGPGPVDLEIATDQVRAAIGQLLGPLSGLAPALDVESLAGLLHDPDRIFGYARLLALLAAVEQAQGRAQAVATRRRALELAEEALRRAEPPPPEWTEWTRAARAETPDSTPEHPG